MSTKSLKPPPAACPVVGRVGKGVGRARRTSLEAPPKPVERTWTLNSDKEMGKEKERGLRLSPAGCTPFTKKKRPLPPLPSAFHPGCGAQAETAPSKSRRLRVVHRVLHPRRRGPCPARTLRAGASPSHSPSLRGRGAADSPRTALPSSSSSPRLLGPPPPAFQRQIILIPPPTPTRGPFENFVHILGRARSPGWVPQGVRDLTMNWGNHRGNPTPLFLTGSYNRVTHRV